MGSQVQPSAKRWRADPAVIALTLLAAALASYRLGTKGLWLDEAVSADHARLGLSGLASVISGRDPNMGLYYLLLHFWVRVFGDSEAAVRSLTVALGALAVPAIVLLGTRLFGRPAGLIAGLLLATSPFFLHYEQTARSYALLVTLVVLSSWLFVAELENHSRWTLVAYVLVSVLAVYTHYFASLVLLVQALTLVLIRRRQAFTREWVGAALAIVVLCVPEAVFAARAGTGAISWIPAPTISSLTHLPSSVAGGSVLAYALIILACVGLISAVREGMVWRAGFLAAWTVVPVLLAFIVSRLGQSVFLPYYLIIVLPPWLLLAGAGLARIPVRAVAIVAGLVVVALGARGIRDWYDQPSVEGYKSATRYILTHERPRDGIVEYPSGTLRGPTSGIAYYEARAGTSGPAPVPFSLGHPPGTSSPRTWLVMRDSDVPAGTRVKVEQNLAAAYRPVGAPRRFTNLTVRLYRLR